jgi:hypothetical protein
MMLRQPSYGNKIFPKSFYCCHNLDPHPTVELLMSVTAKANDRLCCDFTEKDISDAPFQIGPLKASGPDGIPARFF